MTISIICSIAKAHRKYIESAIYYSFSLLKCNVPEENTVFKQSYHQVTRPGAGVWEGVKTGGGGGGGQSVRL